MNDQQDDGCACGCGCLVLILIFLLVGSISTCPEWWVPLVILLIGYLIGRAAK